MADLDLRVLLTGIDRVTGPLKGIMAGSQRTAKALRGAQDALRGLQRQSAMASRQQAQIAALRELGAASAKARAKLASLQAQLLNAHGGAGLQRQVARAQAQVQRLAQREDTLRGKVKAAGEALRAAGYDAARHGQAMAQAEGKVERLQRRMARLGELKRLGQGIGNTVRAARNAAFTLAGVGAAIAAPVAVVARTAGQFERYGAILETIEGSGAKAKAALAWVSDFAAKTPYEIQGVMDAFVKLRAYGIDPMDGTLKILGDTAAAMGKDVTMAVEAISDAMTGEFERLKEFGIKASAIKGTTDTVFDYVTRAGKQMQVKVDRTNRKLVQSTLLAIWNEKYAGAMDKISRTWEGMLSNVRDQWTRFLLLIGESGLFDRLKQGLESLLTRINEMAANGELAALAKGISDNLIRAIESVGRAAEALRPLLTMLGWIGTAFTWVGTIIGQATAQWVISTQRTIAMIGQALSALPEEFSRIGSAIVEGIKRGFADAWGGLKSWVSEKVMGLAAAAKAALGIQSPSKVFAAIGANLMAGLRLGIDRNAQGPVGGINAVTRRLRQAGAGVALGGAVGLAAAAPAGGSTTYNITINAPAGADARALAIEVERAVARLERQRAARARSTLRDID